MKGKIEHQGVIILKEGTHVQVKIVQAAACSGCHAKAICSSAESKEKVVDVYDSHADRYSVGDMVKVCGSRSMGKSAVRIAFGIPVFIIISWMLTAILVLHLQDIVSVAILFAMLAVYFIVLRLNKERLSKNFLFWIEDMT